jgi:hypothetical protein
MVVKPYAPPLPPDLSTFDPPRVREGDWVMCATSPEWRDARPSMVVSSSNGGRDLIVTRFLPDGTLESRFACCHRTDPRCECQRDRFLDNESGVWELSDKTERLLHVEERLRLAEQKLAMLEMRQVNPSPAPPSPLPQISVPSPGPVAPTSRPVTVM